MFSEDVSDKARFVATASDNSDRSEIDISYLAAAAEMYNISPRISDYVLVPVSTVLSDLPNTNGDAMTREELLKFNPQQGRIAYKTWIGKPTFLEHANQVLPGAKGIILDRRKHSNHSEPARDEQMDGGPKNSVLPKLW
jgi:hypothetical protein